MSAGMAASISARVLVALASTLRTAAVLQAQRAPKYTLTEPLKPRGSGLNRPNGTSPCPLGRPAATTEASHSLETSGAGLSFIRRSGMESVCGAAAGARYD
jgi:hypothetical protein